MIFINFIEFIDKYEFIIENEKKQRFLQEIKHYFPSVIKARDTKENHIEYFIEGMLYNLFTINRPPKS